MKNLVLEEIKVLETGFSNASLSPFICYFKLQSYVDHQGVGYPYDKEKREIRKLLNSIKPKTLFLAF